MSLEAWLWWMRCHRELLAVEGDVCALYPACRLLGVLTTKTGCWVSYPPQAKPALLHWVQVGLGRSHCGRILLVSPSFKMPQAFAPLLCRSLTPFLRFLHVIHALDRPGTPTILRFAQLFAQSESMLLVR